MRAEGPPDVPKENAGKPAGSRSLIRHRLFLQHNLHLNPNGVWLKPCGVRSYIPFKSPLFIKYTLQLQRSRYPHFHRISPPTQLKCGAVQWVSLSRFSCLGWSAAAEGWTRLQITRGRRPPRSPKKQGFGFAALGWASSIKDVVICSPGASGCPGGGKRTPRRCWLSVWDQRDAQRWRQNPAQFRALGSAVTQEQLGGGYMSCLHPQRAFQGENIYCNTSKSMV